MCVRHCDGKSSGVEPRALLNPRENKVTALLKIQTYFEVVNEHPVEEEAVVAKRNVMFEAVKKLMPEDSCAHELPANKVTQKALTTEIRYYRIFIAFIVEFINHLCKSLDPRQRPSPAHYEALTREVKTSLLERLCKDLDRKYSPCGHLHEAFVKQTIKLYEDLPPESPHATYIRASMCSAYGESDLEQIIGEPEPWSRATRFRAQEQFRNLPISGDLKNDELNDAFSTLDDDDDDDEAIDAAVRFIIAENCQMFAHGQKRVPVGNGTTALLPVLTRMKPANDIWVDYKTMFDADLRQYARISAHKFVKHTDEYKGSLFNLRVEWKDGGSSWEPMHSVVKSDIIAVAAYGQAHGLLETKGWITLSKQAVKNDVAQATLNNNNNIEI